MTNKTFGLQLLAEVAHVHVALRRPPVKEDTLGIRRPVQAVFMAFQKVVTVHMAGAIFGFSLVFPSILNLGGMMEALIYLLKSYAVLSGPRLRREAGAALALAKCRTRGGARSGLLY
jgi:hypothetical protein